MTKQNCTVCYLHYGQKEDIKGAWIVSNKEVAQAKYRISGIEKSIPENIVVFFNTIGLAADYSLPRRGSK